MSNETAPDSASAQHSGARPDALDRDSAERQLAAAKTSQTIAEKQVRRARRAVRYHNIRLWAANRGVPGSVAGLIAGSIAALLLAMILIVGFGQPISGVFAGVLFGYAICGGAVFWLLRPLNGEGDENVVEIREREANLSMQRAVSKTENASKASEQRRSLERFLQGEAATHQMEFGRQLSANPGHPYLGRSGKPAKMKSCPTCSAPLAMNADPCPRCGHKFGTQYVPTLVQNRAMLFPEKPSPGGEFLSAAKFILWVIIAMMLIGLVVGLMNKP